MDRSDSLTRPQARWSDLGGVSSVIAVHGRVRNQSSWGTTFPGPPPYVRYPSGCTQACCEPSVDINSRRGSDLMHQALFPVAFLVAAHAVVPPIPGKSDDTTGFEFPQTAASSLARVYFNSGRNSGRA